MLIKVIMNMKYGVKGFHVSKLKSIVAKYFQFQDKIMIKIILTNME